jgi:hypothetical protein
MWKIKDKTSANWQQKATPQGAAFLPYSINYFQINTNSS